jgi:hypothetical protein
MNPAIEPALDLREFQRLFYNPGDNLLFGKTQRPNGKTRRQSMR